METTPSYELFLYDRNGSVNESGNATLGHNSKEPQTTGDFIKIYPICFLILGTAGNGFSFVVMKRKSLRRISTSFYLCVLSVSDTIVLWTGLLRDMLQGYTDGQVDINTWTGCKIRHFLFFFPASYSAWLLLAVTLERTIGLYLPFKAKFICTTRNAKIVSLVTAIILTLLNLHFFFIQKLEGSTCVFTSKFSHDLRRNYFPFIDAVVSSYLPALAMLICNLMIIYNLRKQQNMARGNVTNKNEPRAVSKKMLQTTFMLLGISTFFIVSTVPITAYVIMFRALKFEFSILIFDILNMMFYLNFCCNFIFYCYSGSIFRNEMRKILGLKPNTVDTTEYDSTQSKVLSTRSHKESVQWAVYVHVFTT